MTIQKWNDFYAENKYASPFQSSAFSDLIKISPNQSTELFYTGEKGEITSICLATIQKEKGIKGFFSKRAIIYGGPLISDETSFKALLSQIIGRLSKEVIYIEIRNLFDYSHLKSIYENEKWEYVPYLDYVISLQNETVESILKKMKYNRRREIKMSLNEGVIYCEAKEEGEIIKLYQILKDLYTYRVKLPLPVASYFINLAKSGIGKAFIVKHNNNIIGGSFCLFSPGTVYTLYYCGLKEYNKKIFPTHMAIMAAIQFGIENKMKNVDLMGAGKPGEEYGVRQYKSEFGGELVEYGRYVKICKPLLYNLGKTGLNILRKLK